MRCVPEPPINESEWKDPVAADPVRRAAGAVGEAHAEHVSTRPLSERPARRAWYLFVGLLIVALLVGAVVVEGISSRRVVSDGAVRGTVLLTREVEVCLRRRPCFMVWEGRFTSDDGMIDRGVRFADDVPEAQASPGERVEATWTSGNPQNAYLPNSDSFRNWARTTLLVSMPLLLVVAGSLVVWLRGLRRRGARHAGRGPQA
jgi:hypothetical protein